MTITQNQIDAERLISEAGNAVTFYTNELAGRQAALEAAQGALHVATAKAAQTPGEPCPAHAKAVTALDNAETAYTVSASLLAAAQANLTDARRHLVMKTRYNARCDLNALYDQVRAFGAEADALIKRLGELAEESLQVHRKINNMSSSTFNVTEAKFYLHRLPEQLSAVDVAVKGSNHTNKFRQDINTTEADAYIERLKSKVDVAYHL